MLNTEQIDEWTRRLWATSQADRMVISLAGEIQKVVDEMREAAGLEPFRE